MPAGSRRSHSIKLSGDEPLVAFFLQAINACVLDLDVPLMDAP
jgi:hypothetical protein